MELGVERGLYVLDQGAALANVWTFYGNSCVFQPFYYFS